MHVTVNPVFCNEPHALFLFKPYIRIEFYWCQSYFTHIILFIHSNSMWFKYYLSNFTSEVSFGKLLCSRSHMSRSLPTKVCSLPLYNYFSYWYETQKWVNQSSEENMSFHYKIFFLSFLSGFIWGILLKCAWEATPSGNSDISSLLEPISPLTHHLHRLQVSGLCKGKGEQCNQCHLCHAL